MNESAIVSAQTGATVFAVIGDYGLAGQAEADVANLVKSWVPGFIVTVGDNNYPDGAAWSVDQNIGQYYHEYIYPYNGKYGNGAVTRRFFPSIGNHDWGVNAAKPYFDYFGFRNQQSYYDFIQGPIHFFILNSNKEEPDGVTATSIQAKWLKKSLASSTSVFNVVIFHHAAYSSGRHGSNPYMQWPFKEWGADVVLAGHDHVYERLLVNGLPYFVNGVGGSDLYKFETILLESQFRFNQDFGAMRVEATSEYMKFQMITRAGVLVDEYIIGQSIPIVTAINLINVSPTNAGSVGFQVTFSEAVTGVDIADFTIASTINNASITSVSGSGNTYLVSVNSGTSDGTLRLNLIDNDSITNSMGNILGGLGHGNGNFANGQVYSVDKTSPEVTSITRANPNPTNAASVGFDITFSEPVIGLDLSDFGLITNTGALLSGINGSGNSYLISVATGIGDDMLRLDFVDNDSVTDQAGNTTSKSFTSSEMYTVDRSVPYVTSIVRTNQINAPSVDFLVSFSEAVNGVDGSDFFVSTSNGASIANVTGTGSSYTVSISTRTGNDTIRLDLIDDDSIFDNSGNKLGDAGFGNGNFINGEVASIAQNTPNVVSILRASPNPTNAVIVDFIVTFSEPVDGVDITDFMATGNTDAFIINVNNANPFFVVTVNTGTGDGELKLDLMDDDSVRNMQGVSLGGDGAGNANYTTGESFSMDKTPPRATSILRAGNNPTVSLKLDFIITFSEPIVGLDATDFIITTGNLNPSVTNIQNANPFHIVTINSGAGSGPVRLDLFDNGSITDLAGNNLDNGNGSGNFTTGESFTIAKIPVKFPAPNILNASRNALTINPKPNFSWATVRSAQAYEFFIAQDSNFTRVVLTQTIRQTNFTPNAPLADGTYYMRVRAYNADFNPGKFSKAVSFTIDTTPPPPPILASPPNHSTSLHRPQLQWNIVEGGNQYQYELDNNQNFSSPEFTGTTSKNNIRAKSLPKGNTYYWRVRVKDKAGNWSDWSETFNFLIP